MGTHGLSGPPAAAASVAVLLVMSAVLVLAACGGSSTTTSSSPIPTSSVPSYTDVMGGPSPSASSSAVPLPAPTVAGTIVFAKMLNSATGYNSDIYLVDTEGTKLRRLTHDPLWEERPSWSPDGSKILYSVWHEDSPKSATIWVMNADGSSKTKLTKGALRGVCPTWSPDGRQIAFWKEASDSSDEDIYVMNADGSGVKPVAGGISVWEANQGGFENGGGLGWTPDGKILLMRTTREYADVFAVNLDGSGLTQLTKGAQLGTFSLSPDGTRIALDDHKYRLYVAPVQGADQPVTLLDPTYNFMDDLWAGPAWSPDGEALAIATNSINLATGSPIYVINADGSGLSRIPGITRAFDLSWRPE